MGRGPGHLLRDGLVDRLRALGHTVRVAGFELHDPHPAEIRMAFAVCRAVAEQVRAVRDTGGVPLVLSGNCNTAVGTISGLGPERLGVIWFDAHGEFTTPETTTSGFLDGMGLSVLTGTCWTTLARSIPGFVPVPGPRIVLTDARDVEQPEVIGLQEAGVRVVLRRESWGEALDALRGEVDAVYVHLDLDILDPSEATTNQWTPAGGWTVADLGTAITQVRERFTLAGAGLASFDPDEDHDGRGTAAALSLLEQLFRW